MMKFILVLLGISFVSAIKLSIGTEKRCFSDDLWDRQTIRGKYKWTSKYYGVPTLSIKNGETGEFVLGSNQEEGEFTVRTVDPEFCFSYNSGQTCAAWRQTGDCNPHGRREPDSDKSCLLEIPRGMSGYCECQSKSVDDPNVLISSKKYFSCDHEPLTCADVCEVRVDSGAFVVFDFYVGEAKSFDFAATKEHVITTDIYLSVSTDMLTQTNDSIKEAAIEEEEHRSTSEWINFFVIVSHVLPILAFLITSIVQAKMLNSIFRRNNLI